MTHAAWGKLLPLGWPARFGFVACAMPEPGNAKSGADLANSIMCDIQSIQLPR